MKFNEIYRPITATPFRQNEEHVEVIPCEALRPFIRCFWGTKGTATCNSSEVPQQQIIIPDTCMDVIFTMDYSENQMYGSFVGINDRSFSFVSDGEFEKNSTTFAIRFYPWSVICFTEDSISDVKNGYFDAGQHFAKMKKEMESLLHQARTIEERVHLAESFLLQHMHFERQNQIVMEAIEKMLLFHGDNRDIGSVSKDLHISTRQLERLFKEQIGMSPKQLASLFRYQSLWQDIVYKQNFQIQDVVYKYGYTDQAHLLHEFKKYHTMTVQKAKEHAWKDVAFLQDEVSGV